MTSRVLPSLLLAAIAGCTGTISGTIPVADAPADASTSPSPSPGGGGGGGGGGAPAASTILSRVAITTLPGASGNAGAAGAFHAEDLPAGIAAPPPISNTVLSAVPGAPAKPLFVGQDGGTPFDAVLVSVDGKRGYFEVPSAGNPVVALDLVPPATAAPSVEILHVATRTGAVISDAARVELHIDPHVFVAAGDLENHDQGDGSNVADLFGAFLERKQGSPARPEQIADGNDNNGDIVNGIKGPHGPLATGHREVVWDGVPEALRNKPTFSATFFDRLDDGAAGVRGGIVFKATGGTGEEVNDAIGGALPAAGPPAADNGPLGGDFSNHSKRFAGNLLSFTQSAQFATLGTVITDVTFSVAGTDTPAVVVGLGVVFSSVDRAGVTSVEYFDELDHSLARVVAPVKATGPFPFQGPAGDGRFSYSFVGYVDHGARIARVRITAGETPVDQASDDLPVGTGDVVVFDDIYYGEPQP